MSSQKEVVIGKIRQHLQSKFKRYPNAQHHIEQGLQEISKKPTISKNDLDQLEANIKNLLNLSSISQKSSQISMGLKREMSLSNDENNLEKIRTQNPSQETLNIDQSNKSSRREFLHKRYKIPQEAFSKVPGYCDNSLYYLSKMDLNLLKHHEVLDTNQKLPKQRGNSSFTIEVDRSESPVPRLNRSFRGSESRVSSRPRSNQMAFGYRLPPTQKMMEREQRLKEDYWHKIEDFHTKQKDDKQQEIKNQKKLEKNKWVEDLKQQMEDKKNKIELEKKKDYEDGIRFIEKETKYHQEKMEKDKLHKEFITVCEKANYFTDMKNIMDRSYNKYREKAREVFEAEKRRLTNNDEFEKEKIEKFKSTNEWKSEYENAIRQNSQNTSLLKEKERIDDEKTKKTWEELQDKEDNYRNSYLNGLKERTLQKTNPKNTSFYSWKHDDSQNEGVLETHPDSDTGLMKFVYSNNKLQAKKRQLKTQLQQMNQFRQQQAIEKAQREAVPKIISKEQQLLWKNQEEQFEVREKLTKEAERLKKIAQREALDAQLKTTKELKRNSFTEKERKMNRSILKHIERNSSTEIS